MGKKKEGIDTTEDDDDGPTPAKIRNQESSSSKGASHSSNLPKQLMKDLRVKVERLSSEGHEMQTANDAADNKDNVSKSNDANEDRQVPHLPVAEDEPAREITSTCPQGLRKEGSQEDMVTSSCQEPRSKCVLVQTEQIQADGLPPAKVSFQLKRLPHKIASLCEIFICERLFDHYAQVAHYSRILLSSAMQKLQVTHMQLFFI